MLTKARIYFTIVGISIIGIYSKFVQHDSYNDIYLKMIVGAILLNILSYYCEDHFVQIITKGKCKINKKYCKK